MDNFKDFVNFIISFINPLLVLIAGLALLAFVWGLAKFIFRVGGDEKAVDEGKSLMIWGLIGLFVMVSFLGIINLFYEDLGFTRPFGIPFLPTGGEMPDTGGGNPATGGGTGVSSPFNCTDPRGYCPTQ